MSRKQQLVGLICYIVIAVTVPLTWPALLATKTHRIAFMVAVVAVGIGLLWGASRFLGRRIEAAMGLLDAGRLADGEAALRALAAGQGDGRKQSLLAWAAYARLRRGDVAGAIAEWESLRERDEDVNAVGHVTAPLLALAHAIDNREAHARRLRIASPTVDWCFADVILAARAGVADLPVPPIAIEGHDARVFALVRAFAAIANGAAAPAVRDLLEVARPVYAGEFDYLCAQWPAMRQLVAADPWRNEPVAEVPILDDVTPTILDHRATPEVVCPSVDEFVADRIGWRIVWSIKITPLGGFVAWIAMSAVLERRGIDWVALGVGAVVSAVITWFWSGWYSRVMYRARYGEAPSARVVSRR